VVDERTGTRHVSERPIAPYLAVAVGGIAGGYLRVGLSLLPGTGSSASWPWITFTVNVAGTFVLAFAVTLLVARRPSATFARLLIGTGFCGALTTFSTLQLEVFRMLRAGHWPLAAGYLSGSIAAGCVAVAVGTSLARDGRSQ
jgi:CrcB protein